MDNINVLTDEDMNEYYLLASYDRNQSGPWFTHGVLHRALIKIRGLKRGIEELEARESGQMTPEEYDAAVEKCSASNPLFTSDPGKSEGIKKILYQKRGTI